MQEALVYIKNNGKDTNGGMYLTVDSLTEINDIMTGLNSITLRKVNVKPHGFDKSYMDKDLIENKAYQITDQFNERKISSKKFCSTV